MISSVNKLKKNGSSLLFPSYTFLSFTFLSNLFCFRSLRQRVVLLNLLDIIVNPNCLLFSQTEREKERNESSKSSREGVGGWCDGAG